MQYLGGKSRLSKEIAKIINNEICRWKKSHSNEYIADNQRTYQLGGGGTS